MTNNLTPGLRALVAGSLLLASTAILLVTATRAPAAGALAISTWGSSAGSSRRAR